METEIILHRGYKGKYLENSLSSFENAIREGMSFETDIRVSKDKKCFMIHDDNIDRLFNGQGKVGNITSRELRKFHYKEDEGQRLCSFEELCQLAKEFNYDSLIFIHIKELKDIEKVVEVLRKYGLQKNIRFFAVDEIEEDFRKIMRMRYPEYKMGLYLPENSKNYNKEFFMKSDFVWADEITFPWITKEKVLLAHSLGKPFYAISPELIPESIFNRNIQGRWRGLVEAGVDGICTDKPIELSKFLKNY